VTGAYFPIVDWGVHVLPLWSGDVNDVEGNWMLVHDRRRVPQGQWRTETELASAMPLRRDRNPHRAAEPRPSFSDRGDIRVLTTISRVGVGWI
jgi:hypothetical protein